MLSYNLDNAVGQYEGSPAATDNDGIGERENQE